MAIHYLKEVPVVTVHHELAAGQVVAGLSLADLDAVVDGLLAGVAALSGSQASARLADVSRSAANSPSITAKPKLTCGQQNRVNDSPN